MKFEIKEYERFRKVCFYTVHMDGEALSETDKFVERFQNEERYQEYFATIKALIRNIGEYGAAEERKFRFEDNAHALPYKGQNSELRLYCIRCTSNTIILCGGGIKTTRAVQDSPDARPHFELVKKVETLFRERVHPDKTIWYRGNFLEGDLCFDTDF